ncbi:hypothetical protein [Klebsiella oxytoca]|uniref:hypothetical protein n=1 Tax=Klebsiella oxytoca TaxID=571 RepID=UPI001D0E5C71|nr:hypothetical protein [Klebsiella oxytoca]
MTSKLTREFMQNIISGHGFGVAPSAVKAMAEYIVAAMDSEPVAYTDERNLGYIDRGRETAYLWGKQNSEAGDVPLYRHAQQPVVPEIDRKAIADKVYGKCCRIPGATFYNAAEFAIDEVEACRAAMLQAGNCRENANSSTNNFRKISETSTNSPVIPDGYVMVPMRLTAENGAKGVLSGEFSETKFVNCPECFGDDECETCDGSGRIEIKVPVSWTTIKDIWIKGVEHFAAAPQENI